MKRQFNYFGKYIPIPDPRSRSNKDLMTIELDECYADKLYIALLASKIVLRESVELSEEYDFVSDLIVELGRYRRSR